MSLDFIHSITFIGLPLFFLPWFFLSSITLLLWSINLEWSCSVGTAAADTLVCCQTAAGWTDCCDGCCPLHITSQISLLCLVFWVVLITFFQWVCSQYILSKCSSPSVNLEASAALKVKSAKCYDLQCFKWSASERPLVADSFPSIRSIGVFFFVERALSGFHQAAECILSFFKTLLPGSSVDTLDNETQETIVSWLIHPAPNPPPSRSWPVREWMCVCACWKGELLQPVIYNPILLTKVVTKW